MAVGGPARSLEPGQQLAATALPLGGPLDRLRTRVGLDHPVRAVHQDLPAVLQFRGGGAADDGGQTERLGGDGRVTGRPAADGDEGQHPLGVEQRGVGGRQVVGDQDVRMPGVGRAGHGQAEQVRHRAEAVEGGGERVGAVGALLCEGGGPFGEDRVGGHHGLGREHLGAGAAHAGDGPRGSRPSSADPIRRGSIRLG